MRRLRSFFRLSPTDRMLTFSAWVRLVRMYFVLRALPFHKLRERMERPYPIAVEQSGVGERQIIRAVERASRYVLARRTCLTRAIVAREMLARHGYPSELRIGVRRGADGKFEAHAWLVRDNLIIIGDLPDLHRYQVMPSIERRAT